MSCSIWSSVEIVCMCGIWTGSQHLSSAESYFYSVFFKGSGELHPTQGSAYPVVAAQAGHVAHRHRAVRSGYQYLSSADFGLLTYLLGRRHRHPGDRRLLKLGLCPQFFVTPLPVTLQI